MSSHAGHKPRRFDLGRATGEIPIALKMCFAVKAKFFIAIDGKELFYLRPIVQAFASGFNSGQLLDASAKLGIPFGMLSC